MSTLDAWDEEVIRAFHEQLNLPNDAGMAQPFIWWLKAEASS